jgi:putative membrane protein
MRLSAARTPEPETMALFAEGWTTNSFEMSLLAAAAFGLLGIAMLVVGFKIFEWLTPSLKVEEELTKGNTAVGITVAALLIAISLIVIRAIGG